MSKLLSAAMSRSADTTILLRNLAFSAASEHRAFHPLSYVVIGVISLSMTITNWMAGLLATLRSHGLPRSFRITVDVFALTALIWAIQNALYNSSKVFLFSPEEQKVMLVENAGGVFEKSVVFFIHSMVMPALQYLDNSSSPSWPHLSVQFADVGSAGTLAWLSTIIWIGLLSFGARTAWRSDTFRKFKFVLIGTICGQFLLHLVYGEETFLYALRWLPLLVILASFAAATNYRWTVLTFASVLIIAVGFNNFQQFELATSELVKKEFAVDESERGRLLVEK